MRRQPISSRFGSHSTDVYNNNCTAMYDSDCTATGTIDINRINIMRSHNDVGAGDAVEEFIPENCNASDEKSQAKHHITNKPVARSIFLWWQNCPGTIT